MDKKRVYTFGNGKAEGKAEMKNLLGGKGANLAEMNLIGVPVPAGFTITTEVCTEYNLLGKDKVVALMKAEVEAGIAATEKVMNAKFGSKGEAFPLLVSVRSGARASMPGMMNTVLNLGMNDDAVKIVAEKSGNEKFAYDSYRRFIHMYGDVVMGVVAKEGEHDPFEVVLDKIRDEKGYKSDADFTAEDLKNVVTAYKSVVKERAGKEFPSDPWEQLWGAICAVFDSWNTERAILYRRMEQIPDEWGTAVNVQAMVYGNMGDTSATGVCFSRDAATGEDQFNGEYLIDAQGEDVVAGIRTPLEITKIGSKRWAERNGTSEADRLAKFPSLEETMPDLYKQLNETQQN
jgi:pyruvate, orthophosphate dikinase